jgi:hypothetical protein
VPTATFQADFTKWNQALENAKGGLKSFEVSAKGVQQQLERTAKGFAGVDIKRQAEVAAAAVEKIGGVTKLTEQEQRKLTATVDEALAKYKALGEVAPQSLKQIRGELDKLEAENKQLAEAAQHLKDLGSNAAQTSAPVEASALSFTKLAGSVFTAQAAYDAVRGAGRLVIGFLNESIQSYASAEAAQKKLTVALEAQGTATPHVIDQYNHLASTFQRTTVYSDDLINEMEALLTQVGNVMPQDMDKALTAATDLASGLGIDLQQATTLVAKSLEGNVGALGRYGVSLDESRVKAEGVDYVVGKLEERFGGQAQAQLDTYAGRIQALANDWDNLKEAVGKIIVSNPVVEAGLRGVASVVADLGDGSGAASTRLSDLSLGFSQLAQNIPVVGEGVAAVSALFGGQIGVVEDLASAVNDYYKILNKLSRDAPKLPQPEAAKPITGGFEIFDKEVEAHEKAQKAAEAHAEAIRKLREQMSGAALLRDLADATDAFRGLPKPVQDSEIAQRALAEAFVRALPAMENATGGMLKQQEAAAGLAVRLGLLEPAVDNAASALRGLGQQISVDSFFGGLDSVGFEDALVRPFQSLKTVGSTIPTSVLFPIQEKMSALAKTVASSFSTMSVAIEGSFAQMLLGAKGFHDGFLDIWESLKAGIARILTQILGDFTSRFLRGLLGALTGAKGSFSSAFAGLLGGGGSGGLGLLGGLFGAGGSAGTIGASVPVSTLFGGGGGAAAAGGGGLFGLGRARHGGHHRRRGARRVWPLQVADKRPAEEHGRERLAGYLPLAVRRAGYGAGVRLRLTGGATDAGHRAGGRRVALQGVPRRPQAGRRRQGDRAHHRGARGLHAEDEGRGTGRNGPRYRHRGPHREVQGTDGGSEVAIARAGRRTGEDQRL